MNRRYLKLFLSVIVASFIISACKEDERITHFSTSVDVSQSNIPKYTATNVFSTDNGATFVPYANISVGQTYQAKVMHGSADVIEANCYNVDWSASKPAPSSVEGGIATFVMGTESDLRAAVANIPVVASELEGTYTVVTDDWVDFHPGDEVTVEVIDATHIQVVEYPATAEEHSPMVITISDLTLGTAVVENQYSGSYGGAANKVNTSGSGSVSCIGTIDLTLAFKFPSANYTGNHFVITKN